MESPRTSRSELPSVSTTLLSRVKEMQPEAWACLVNIYSPIVYRWARTSGLSEQDSADVVQDVFVAITRNIATFERKKDHGSFRGWLATITRNRVRDCFRKKKNQLDADGGTEALQQLNAVPGNALNDNLDQSISLESLDRRLPIRILEIVRTDCEPRTWQAFWLTTVKDHSAAEVAQQLEMEIASVYQAKSRVLRRLRKRLAELP